MHLEKRVATLIDLGFHETHLPQLRSYLQLLQRSNEELNLISRQMTHEELIDNHVIDCLLPLKYFPAAVKVAADFGSGGGLPSVLYAIQFPEIEWRLFEKSPKKREFLEQCRSFVPNLRIHGEIPRDFQGVDLVTARAFKPLDVILDVSRQYYARGGRYFLLKGRLERIEEELALARKKFKNLNVEIKPLHSPVLEVERHLVLI